ncbi:MAG: cation transporting ATPase C-terminal domain-containing protein [Bdellovibrionales bacterium]|nr:cation transporting ATPase C-terminal domain-containing protein [Bdellovibrionales bacterium]
MDGDANYNMIDWVYLASSQYDLRMTMLDCTMVSGSPVWSPVISTWGVCHVQQISPYTNLPVCYTTEACKYAQTAYLIGVVFCQIANGYACKTRKTSVMSQGTSNIFFHFALTTEILLILLLAYFEPLSTSFGFRDTIFMHFGMPTIPFTIIILIVDETRKYYVRSLPSDENGKPHWFTRAALW